MLFSSNDNLRINTLNTCIFIKNYILAFVLETKNSDNLKLSLPSLDLIQIRKVSVKYYNLCEGIPITTISATLTSILQLFIFMIFITKPHTPNFI